MIESPFFYSKILLFGEYSIILHSMGLAVPYHLFGGRLVLKHITDSSRRIQQSNRELKAFCEYIGYKSQQNQIAVDFDFTSLEFDIAQGLYFQSNIPQGFGVGSSGALTAALYERYVYHKMDREGVLANEDIIFEDKLQIYPQPASEEVFISSNSNIDQILVCDLAGKEVLEVRLLGGQSNLKISLKNLKSGIYILKIAQKGTFVSKKLWVE